MLGVVIWSDESSKKAVIWCEDHGDLAFYKEQDADEVIMLGAGDLVEFEVTMERQFRYVKNPQLVSDSYSSGLADALTHGSAQDAFCPPQPDRAERGSADVIPFELARSERARELQAETRR